MLDKFEIVMRQAGLWVGFILAVGALYGAGPFPFLDQGVRLGGAIGAGVMIMLTTRPLAKQFGEIPNSLTMLLWAVDLVVLVGFIFTG